MNEKLILAQKELLSKGTIWILFLFLGWSYGSMGKIGTQILFYITFGGIGIWALVRLFTLNGAIKGYNKAICVKYGLDANDMLLLGVL
jgi:hypothetical protein